MNGAQFFPAMLQAIDTAREFLFVEMYLVESGAVATRFIDALLQAVGRRVGVYLLLDDYGARGLNRRDRQRLLLGGIRLSFYNPLRYGTLRRNLFRDHRKLLIADGRVAFVGGAGITDEFDPIVRPHDAWRDTLVQITGPCVADWCKVFVTDWAQWADAPFAGTIQQPADSTGGQAGRVAVSVRFGSSEIQRSFVKRIHTSERRVWMATAYFVPSWKLRRALRFAARHGVDVRLLLPGAHTDHPGVRHAGRRYYTGLLRAGVRIFEYQPSFMHAKVLLCDDWVSVGSSNVDRWNLRWNLEGNQEVDDTPFAQHVQAMFEHDFAESHECNLEIWTHRSWWYRLPEWFWGNVDAWLENVGRRVKARLSRRQ